MKHAFRPVFLLAILFSLVSTAVWFAIFFLNQEMGISTILPISWHAHEMIFGLGFAVIAGYLIFVPRILGGQQASYQLWMHLFMLVWLLPRLLPFIEHESSLFWMFLLDTGVGLWLLMLTILKPVVIKTGIQRWFVSLLVAIMTLANTAYYLGLLEKLSDGERLGLFLGLYTLLVLLVFINERAVAAITSPDSPGKEPHYRLPVWLLLTVLILTLLVGGLDLQITNTQLITPLNVVLAILFVFGFLYRVVIGNRSDLLNWAIAAAYLFIALGFALKSMGSLNLLLPKQAIQAFSIGAIGLLMLTLIASSSPRKALIGSSRFSFAVFLMFGAISGAAVISIFAPLWLAPKYMLIIAASQLGWIIGMLLVLIVFTPVLLSKKRRSKSRSHHKIVP